MRGFIVLVAAALMAGVLGGAAMADQKVRPLAADPATDVKLEGDFEWSRKKGRNPVKAVLTPDGEGKYKAKFDFKWGGRDVHYTGTLVGSLDSGDINGTATDGKRTWIFKGTATDGTLNCKHWETTGGKEVATGDVVFKRV